MTPTPILEACHACDRYVPTQLRDRFGRPACRNHEGEWP